MVAWFSTQVVRPVGDRCCLGGCIFGVSTLGSRREINRLHQRFIGSRYKQTDDIASIGFQLSILGHHCPVFGHLAIVGGTIAFALAALPVVVLDTPIGTIDTKRLSVELVDVSDVAVVGQRERVPVASVDALDVADLFYRDSRSGIIAIVDDGIRNTVVSGKHTYFVERHSLILRYIQTTTRIDIHIAELLLTARNV